ncbi:hypothetical protein GLOIN_2v1783204 [Rhizophagus clarus]|uniref:Uncharacterized protein n=1 Tax=Rhizophagus clarus TaxID=94130 RepID=A0A8H3LP34_9GLOM|nr:hypothetical protein GLOIN_2v1783204 [Rhizophagus clarus]
MLIMLKTRTTLNNYLLPQQSNSIAAKAHHYLTWITVADVLRTKIRDHSDGHYCLTSVKSARQFATIFADKIVIISQDDKAKIGLKVPAVGQTFCTLQSVHEPVSMANHNFLLENEQKLVSSVYLMIKLNELHDESAKYNPVERGITTLSRKLASIMLPVDHFGSHLNIQGKVIDLELALQNFCYAEKSLCDIWCKDLIFRKSVDAQYVEEFTNLFKT